MTQGARVQHRPGGCVPRIELGEVAGELGTAEALPVRDSARIAVIQGAGRDLLIVHLDSRALELVLMCSALRASASLYSSP